MTVIKTFLATGLAAALFAAPAQADPKPAGAQPASAQAVAQAYAGKSEDWDENCNGGIYYAPNWQARAWCGDTPDAIGAGRWTVDDQGTLCTEMGWFSPEGNGAAEKDCIAHVADRRGRLWRNWPGESEWWPLRGAEGFSRGYKYRGQVDSVRQKLGLKGG